MYLHEITYKEAMEIYGLSESCAHKYMTDYKLSLIHIQMCIRDRFSIPDHGLLCLFQGNGDRHFAVCHRLDDTHAEIDGVNYSMPDFAKRMKHEIVVEEKKAKKGLFKKLKKN